MTRLILYPAAKTDVSYAIPDGVRNVKEGAIEGGYVFGNNPYLRHLAIPASFTCEGRDSYGNASSYFNALLHLPALQDVTVDPANPTFANGDGVLDLKDVVLLRRFLAGGWNVTVDTDNMDVDGDGAISLKDCTLLSRYLAGGWNVTLQ